MAYTLNAIQTTSLEIIKKASPLTTVKIAQKLGFTNAIVYRNIRELLAIDAIKKNGVELKLTDFGEILLL